MSPTHQRLRQKGPQVFFARAAVRLDLTQQVAFAQPWGNAYSFDVRKGFVIYRSFYTHVAVRPTIQNSNQANDFSDTKYILSGVWRHPALDAQLGRRHSRVKGRNRWRRQIDTCVDRCMRMRGRSNKNMPSALQLL